MATKKLREDEYLSGGIERELMTQVTGDCGLRLQPHSLDTDEGGEGLGNSRGIEEILTGVDNFDSPTGPVRLDKIFPK